MKYNTTRSSVPGNRIGEASRIDQESLKSVLNDLGGLDLEVVRWGCDCDGDGNGDGNGDDDDDEGD